MKKNWHKLNEPAHIDYLRKLIVEHWAEIMPKKASRAKWLAKPLIEGEGYLDGLVEGWNACLIKIKQKCEPQ